MSGHRRIAIYFGTMVAIASALVPLHLDAQRSDGASRLGVKLMCVCGCGQILTQCNHINCPSSVPMLKQLEQHLARNESDDLILQAFVQEYGEKVLSEPPTKGFNSIAWYIPGAAFAVGLAIVVMVIRLWRHRETESIATAPAAPGAGGSSDTAVLKAAQLERARKQADRETEE